MHAQCLDAEGSQMNKTLSLPWRKLNSVLTHCSTLPAQVLAEAAPNTYSHREVFILCTAGAVWVLHINLDVPLSPPPTPTPFLPFLWDYLDSLLASQYLRVEVLF